MATDGRDRITLYHAALEHPPGDRAAFLRDACAGNEALRREVESLLRQGSASSAFLEAPAFSALAAHLPDSSTAMIGGEFGPYRITSLLGVGGMGEVFRARDNKLGRDVALKMLPHQFTTDPERRGRFAREARVLAALKHPHIAAIHGLEEIGDRTALVLELVEGPTLADQLELGPMSLPDALSIARQLVEALDAAHLKGIVHRDLKPANIVLEGSAATAPGDCRVKVLDFGIAKTVASDADATQSHSAALDWTEDGRILGTPAYMSPEQARGQSVDKRSDIWAFGCVLFEMLTGRRAFPGEGNADTLARVLEHDPDWTAIPTDTPPSIQALLRRCLQKDPQRRLRDIADARIEIDGADPAGTSQPIARAQDFVPPLRQRPARLVWVTAAFLIGALLAAGSFALWQRRSAPTVVESLELEIGPPPGARFPAPVAGFAIAPDGGYVAMAAFGQKGPALWVRRMGSSEYRQIRGTEGAVHPFWSPDSRQIGFFADGKLKTVGLRAGDAPFVVCDAISTFYFAGGGAWNRDDVILLRSEAGPIQKVPARGGIPTPVTTLKGAETQHRWPSFLPDGQHFLYVALGPGAYQLHVGSLTSTNSKPLGTIRSSAIYAGGRLLFVQGGLMAQPFDLRSLELRGDPHPLNEQMAVINGLGIFSVSEQGRLGYSAEATGSKVQLTWMGRTGNRLGTVGKEGTYYNLRLSPDDRLVAVSSQAADGNVDIWRIDPARGVHTRVTDAQGGDHDPAWSPDGQHLAFISNRDGSTYSLLFRRPFDGSASDQQLANAAPGSAASPDWSPQGELIVFDYQEDLWVQSADDAKTRWPFLKTPFVESSATFSPDGRWVAYSSDRTGRPEIYVRSFPAKDSQQPGEQISLDGGRFPRWRNDREIFFLSLNGTLMSARFNAAQHPPWMIPQPLFQTGITTANHNHPYDVAKDGQRFLIPVPTEAPDAKPIAILTDWTARLRK